MQKQVVKSKAIASVDKYGTNFWGMIKNVLIALLNKGQLMLFNAHFNIRSRYNYKIKMIEKEVEDIESRSNEMSTLLSSPDNKVFRKFLSDYNKIVGTAFLVSPGVWASHALPLLILQKAYKFCAPLKNPFINKKVTEYLLNKKEYSNLSKSQPALAGFLA